MSPQKTQFARSQADMILSRLKKPAGSAAVREVVELVESLTGEVENALRHVDEEIAGELGGIAGDIRAMREELAALSAEAHDGRIPEAGEELTEVARETEAATNTIMAAAETILSLEEAADSAYREKVEAQVMEIFQACSFQDITGQRITKVVTTLSAVEERIAALLDAIAKGNPLPQARRIEKDPLLNGPHIGGPEVSQDDIDALFD